MPKTAFSLTAFENIFREHYAELCRIAYPVTKDKQAAQDIVHDVFLKLWERRSKLQIDKTLKGYLYKAVVYSALDYVKKESKTARLEVAGNRFENAKADNQDLKVLIKKGVEQLPEKCRIVFALSRYHDMKNKEIAAYMDISVKTVENQMTKALRHLRGFLKENGVELSLAVLLKIIEQLWGYNTFIMT